MSNATLGEVLFAWYSAVGLLASIVSLVMDIRHLHFLGKSGMNGALELLGWHGVVKNVGLALGCAISCWVAIIALTLPPLGPSPVPVPARVALALGAPTLAIVLNIIKLRARAKLVAQERELRALSALLGHNRPEGD